MLGKSRARIGARSNLKAHSSHHADRKLKNPGSSNPLQFTLLLLPGLNLLSFVLMLIRNKTTGSYPPLFGFACTEKHPLPHPLNPLLLDHLFVLLLEEPLKLLCVPLEKIHIC